MQTKTNEFTIYQFYKRSIIVSRRRPRSSFLTLMASGEMQKAGGTERNKDGKKVLLQKQLLQQSRLCFQWANK